MKALMTALFVALPLVGCQSDVPRKINLEDSETRRRIIARAVEEVELQKRGKNGDEIYYAHKGDKPYTGWTKATYENGHVKFLNQYTKGKLDGLFITWRANGRMESLETYREGLSHGVSRDWFTSGQEKSREYYRNGQREGPCVRWYRNGQKQSEENYLGGELHGASYEWYPLGKVDEMLSYRDGKPNGTWIYFNPDGSERYRETYHMGEIVD